MSNIIKKRTNELAGKNKDIVKDPIFLSIRSKKLPNLTLIDLPGFTKLQTDDQASDISKDIEKLVMKYIEKENTIILAISPANGDIANSDGLAYAKIVDPNRDRTFGVMTKVDIMDKGTDACDYLSGKLYKLKHGYIAVKCRSQADNNDGKTIALALKEEKEFFENHHAYSKFAETQGIPMLANKLSQLLQKHIIKQLPKIEELIHQNYEEYAQILEEVGKEDLCETEFAAKDYIIRAIDEFKDEFKNVVYKASNQIKDVKNGAYTGGSKIYQLFKHFADEEINSIDPLLVLSDQKIMLEMRNCYGLEPGLFIPEEACKSLIKDQISSFKQPIEELTQYVLATLKEVASSIIRRKFSMRQNLGALFGETMDAILTENFEKLTKFLSDNIKSEMSYLNYDHEDFVQLREYIVSDEEYKDNQIEHLKERYGLEINLFKKKTCLRQIEQSINEAKRLQNGELEKLKHKKVRHRKVNSVNIKENIRWELPLKMSMAFGLASHEKDNIIYMKRVIHVYFSILKKNLKADIPKYIVMHIIERTIDDTSSRLHKAVSDVNNSLFLVSENKDIVQKRQIAVDNIKKLETALTAINALKRKQSIVPLFESDLDDSFSDNDQENQDEEMIISNESAM